MKRYLSLLLPVLALLMMAQPAAARELQLELGAFGGGFFISGANGLGRYYGDYASNALRNSGLIGVRVGFIVHPRISLEGELMISPTQENASESQVVAFGWRAHLLVHILTGRVRPFVLLGGGGLTSSPSAVHSPTISKGVDQDTDGEIHGGVGLKVDVNKARTLGIRGDVRVFFSPAINGDKFSDNYEFHIGLYGLFPGNKREPVATVPAPTVVRSIDLDNDGVPDKEDKCPIEAGPRENGGCPDKDSDGDGIVDRLDKCPSEKGVAETEGCPDKDADGDGVVDRLDKCPNDKGVVENGGCPDKDADNDGIVDRLDKCPNEPETVNGYQDADGCPDEAPKALKEISGALSINFATGKAVITPASKGPIDKIAATLKEYPDTRVEISGHTSASKKPEADLALSRARAEALKAALVQRGIAADRIRTVGFGATKPAVPGNTKAARLKNQRVELRFLRAGE